MNVRELLESLGAAGVEVWCEGTRLRYRAPQGALSAEQRGLLSQHREEVIQALQELRSSQMQQVPLSHEQRALWFLYQDAPASAVYNVAFNARITSPVDAVALHRAVQVLVDRHAVLRTTYDVTDGVPMQRIAGWSPAVIERPDVTGLSDGALHAQVEADYRRPFDLARGPVLRTSLYSVGPADHVLLISAHHIAVDGWSLFLLLEELQQLYREYAGGASASLARPEAEYADYVAWQTEQLGGPEGERLWSYWRDKLAGPRAILEVPADRRRPAVKGYRGASLRFPIDPGVVTRAGALARAEGTTLFVVLLAAFKTLLFRYSGTDDVIVGTPSFGRSAAQFSRVVGHYVNLIPLRTRLDGELSFRELLGRVRETVLGGLDAQEYPMSLLVERLQPVRDPSRSPLFEALFSLQRFDRFRDLENLLVSDASDAPIDFGGMELRPYLMNQQEGQFDLSLQLVERGDALTGGFKYNTDLFDIGTIERLAAHFNVLLQGAVDSPATALGDLPLLTAGEAAARTAQAGTATRLAPSLPLHEQFARQVQRSPDRPAITFGDASITYGELNRRANQLAHELQALGVAPDTLVGLCAERSIDLVVGLLGILKAGGAYLPIDLSYPADRVAFMLQDAQAPVLVTQRHLDGQLPGHGGATVYLEDDRSRHPTTDPDSGATPDNLIYAIYTSGSTGKPKGTLLTHHAVDRLFRATDEWYHFGAQDVWTLFHSVAFDFSVWELWGALLHGGRLVIVPYMVSRSPEEFLALVRRENVTVLNQTPSAFRALIQADLSGPAQPTSLRYVVFGGEALELRSLRPWVERHGDTSPVLVNMYGITETCVHVTYRPLTRQDVFEASGSVIGVPIPDLRLHVLDPRGKVVPTGVAGELYVGGAGLARGYLRRPELTAERFIPDPWLPGERLYRTGDLARWLPDGDLEYLGRIDHQVKIRGFRIELGEIEAAVASHPAVREQVVLAREDTPGDRRLVAYVVASGDRATVAQELRAMLKERLPDYMVPSAIEFLDALPLTSNGKVDRQALPAPDRPLETRNRAPLRTPTEQALGEIWRGVLSLDEVGRSEDFFELGGHSLLVTQVASRIRDVFQLQLPLSTIFEAATIEMLAQRIDGMIREDQSTPMLPPIEAGPPQMQSPLSFSQQRMWLIHSLAAGSTAYNMPVSFWLRGVLDVDALQRALDEVVRRHDTLRSTYRLEGTAPVSEVQPEQVGQFRIADLRSLGSAAKDAALQEAAAAARLPFDLEQGPVLRSLLLRTGDEEHLALLCLHHVAGDLWSFGVLLNELSELYNAFRAGLPSPCKPLLVQYGDYARWQRNWLQGEMLERQVGYWRKRLDGLVPLDLPTDRPRPALQTFSGGRLLEPLEPELVRRLEQLSRQEGGTLFMTMCAVFIGLLRRYASQDDIAISVPIANRTSVEVEHLIGTFVNTLVLRTDCSADPSFRELHRRVRAGALEAYAHQDVSFEVLVDEIKLPRDASRAPFANVLFNVLNTPMDPIGFEDLDVTAEIIDRAAAQFDISLAVETASIGVLVVEYNDDLYDQDTIRRLMSHYRQLLEAVIDSPDTSLSALPMLPEVEQGQLVRWNETGAPYPDDTVLARLVEARVVERPDAIAVAAGGTSLSFATLNREANRVARHLRTLGVGPGVRVGLCMPRTPELLVALLGIHKAGASYVPLDPAFPVDRLTYMLEDSGATVLVTHPGADVELPVPDGVTIVDLATAAGTIAAYPSDNLEDGARPADEAYVIYTSGSTGKPKGVCVSHGALVNFLWSMRREPGLSETDVLAAVTTLSFDIAGLELYLPLVVGARIELIPREETADGVALAARLAKSGATVMQATPATWRMLIEAGWSGARGFRVFCGGEALSRELADALLVRADEVWNLYGPTETTIWSTLEQVHPGAESISIGRPIANTQVHVLDARGLPTPIGVPGELCIGGAGVAIGYHERPELTASRFIPDPFSAEPGARLYRTGDRARWRADGRLECLGRLDHQVKIRGFRIELGEIESTLAAHPAVREVSVVPREAAPGDMRLVAYVVYQPGQDLTVSEVRRFLRRDLPDYMVPSLVVPLEALPLTANNKVDRARLPDPYAHVVQREAPSEPPAPGEEQSLAEVWQEVLKVPSVGAEDNFFDLGGHSLLALRATALFEKRTGRRLDPRTMYFQSLRQIVEGSAATSLHTATSGT